jgi:hypothetical protein
MVLPHCGHLFSTAARQRLAALRVRNRIFEVLRFGTPIIASGNKSRKSRKGKRSRGKRVQDSGVQCRERPTLRCLNPENWTLNLVLLQFQLIQRAPIGRPFLFLSRSLGLGGLADTGPISITVRMRGKIQQKVFADEWAQIHGLGSGEFNVCREQWDLDYMDKFFQTRDALELDRLPQITVRPQRISGKPDVQFVLKRANATDVLGFELGDWAILFPFEM